MSSETGTKTPGQRIHEAYAHYGQNAALDIIAAELDREAERRAAWEAKVEAEFRKLGCLKEEESI